MTNLHLSRHKIRLIALLGAAMLAIVILAAGLSRLELQPGQSIPIAGILQALSDASVRMLTDYTVPVEVVYGLTGCLWVLFVASIIAFIISPQIRKQVFKQAALFLFYFLIALTFLRYFRPEFLSINEDSGGTGEAQPEIIDPTELIPTPPDFIIDPPQWFVLGISILLIAIPLIIGWVAWRLVVAHKNDDTTLEQLTQEARQALTALQSGADFKNTVLRCYAEMSRILDEAQGLQRQAGMTAREFEKHLAQSGLRSEHIHRLTRLFEDVRYGSKSLNPQQEQEAVACLTTIVQSYGSAS